ASRGIEDIYELTYLCKDGNRLPAVVSVTALRDAQDVIIGYLLIGTDITARKQVEEERKRLDQRLRDQQFYTRSLIESNIDAIMATDPAGFITDVNEQMIVLTGCTRDELIGAPFRNYFTDPEKADAAIRLALSAKKVSNYELTARARDGKETTVSFNAMTFYDRDRNLQGVFAAARDVTERKRLDQVLRLQNIELEHSKSLAEKANLAKSDFLSSMSHELRSPLNAIIGFAQLMESDRPAPNATQQGSIDQILQAGWYLLELINEILDLALIESGRLSPSLEPVALRDVLLECQDLVMPQATKHAIALAFPALDDVQFVVCADRTRLKQVLINLLSNAIKYNRPAGTVTVDCSAQHEGRIRVTVTDTGDGLTADQLAQLFQSFNRLGRELGSEQGTGIGLVVSKRLVEMMKGEIGVSSTLGVGSAFWFELPMTTDRDANATVAALAEEDAPLLATGERVHTLLYVEDNPANLKLIEQVIARRSDMRMLQAGDALLGIEIARAERPDVILMDINLPGMSGLEALRVLARDPATSRIPIIALSANAMPRDVARGLAAGFYRYLTKPVRIPEFLETLDAALALAAERQGATTTRRGFA
ncbi:MAG: PAS domain S-box protein, partial [Gemmatimonadaceae bacterium]|nr:PAS domain S-box protein [Gemmatimonadaceae bacterium]